MCTKPLEPLQTQRGFVKPLGPLDTHTYTHKHISVSFLLLLIWGYTYQSPDTEGTFQSPWGFAHTERTLQSPLGFIHLYTHFGLFSYKYRAFFTNLLYKGALAHTDGALQSSIQRQLKKLPRGFVHIGEALWSPKGLCTHIHTFQSFCYRYRGYFTNSLYRGSLLKLLYRGALYKHTHTFQSELLQIWGCFIKPKYNGALQSP